MESGIEASEYLSVVHGMTSGDAPAFDMDTEIRVQEACLTAIRAGIVRHAHDVSDGGLAVCLAESVLVSGGLGANIELEAAADGRLDGLLFGEAQSRIVVSVRADDASRLEEIAEGAGAELRRIGRVTNEADSLKISVGGEQVLETSSNVMKAVYEETIPRMMA